MAETPSGGHFLALPIRLLPRGVAVRSTGFAAAARLDELATDPVSDASRQQ